MTEQRRHFKQALSLKQRLLDRVRSVRDEANSINPGLERETEAALSAKPKRVNLKERDKIFKVIRDHHERFDTSW